MTQQPIRARSRPIDDHVRRDAVWKGNDLVFRRRVVALIEPDSKYPTMWRGRVPSGHVTDMVNLTRAKDAAVSLVAAEIARPAPPVRLNREAAE